MWFQDPLTNFFQPTDRACPGTHVPLTRQSDSIHVGPDGRLVVPEGVATATVVPFSH
ncbi:MAG: hypothetical protein QOF76_3650 [Solirubrobacteraceae bacterium]|nr:hypothetical protein [Solirubrobacteraceae bacterium]